MESGSWRGGMALGYEGLLIPENKTADRGQANRSSNEHGPVEMFRELVSVHARQSAADEVVPRAGAG